MEFAFHFRMEEKFENGDILREEFRAEAAEIIQELESSLLALEKNPLNAAAISSVLRDFHTLKGSGAMCGFDDVSGFTHHLESVYDLVRSGRMALDKAVIELTLNACDLIKLMITAGRQDQEAMSKRQAELLALFDSLADNGQADTQAFEENLASGKAVYRIRLSSGEETALSGPETGFLIQELRKLGECAVTSGDAGLEIYIGTQMTADDIRDVFIISGATCIPDIQSVERAKGPASKMPAPSLAKREQASCVQTSPENSRSSISSIRVPFSKLDELLNLVSELVTVQARLSRVAAIKADPQIISISEEVERLTADLRANAMNIRMMPIGTIFGTFKRLVRDLATGLGKEAELVAEGGETELDKTVIEKLNDALVHIVRNSIDHGVEPPDKRELAGKPRKGTISLSAAHSGDKVVIRIADDGAGLDREAILAKAAEKGLIAPGESPQEKETALLVLTPGFSTAKDVTDISGRGVGLDVVKKTIDALGGSLSLESSRGEGTVIVLSLPLTLAIIEGLLVKAGEGHFILPLSDVRECVELSAGNGSMRAGHIVQVRDRLVPYVRLREQFAIGGALPPIEHVIVMNVNGEMIGIAVDQVIGGHQTVIKPLGKVFKDLGGISGATILGDGTLALIVDMPDIARTAEMEEALTKRAPGMMHAGKFACSQNLLH
ncbi:MAG: chemotaxis protein CheA [Nitrospiraceae bacterium]|nr:chemotaxis protein CheA [Nitrospiraceae bacterium]